MNMEQPSQNIPKEEKQYLYHKVPKEMDGETLYPLSVLKEKNPELYAAMIEKYKGREEVMQKPVVSLEPATWTDVIHLSAVHPEELKKALLEAGMESEKLEGMEFYQIDPDLLEKEQTTVFLQTPDSEEFTEYDSTNLVTHSSIPEYTKKYYKNKLQGGETPLFFLGVPHILHKGTIKTSDFPVIKI
jgi:hypothetical protein